MGWRLPLHPAVDGEHNRRWRLGCWYCRNVGLGLCRWTAVAFGGRGGDGFAVGAVDILAHDDCGRG